MPGTGHVAFGAATNGPWGDECRRGRGAGRFGRMLTEDVIFFNEQRPHQGLVRECPSPLPRGPSDKPVPRRTCSVA